MYVCICHPTTEQELLELAERNSATTVQEIRKCSRVGADCGLCLSSVKLLLKRFREDVSLGRPVKRKDGEDRDTRKQSRTGLLR